jgi:tRNA (guanine37-N1)-methyltransferase
MEETLWSVTVLTLFPEMFPGPLGFSLAGKALKKGIWSLNTLNLRDFGIGPHRTIDDTPFGGGAGMVLRPDVIDNALLSLSSNKKVQESSLKQERVQDFEKLALEQAGNPQKEVFSFCQKEKQSFYDSYFPENNFFLRNENEANRPFSDKPLYIYLSPRGKPFDQNDAKVLTQAGNVVLLCGRYEGVDQRVIEKWNMREVSIGDFILSGGEIGALALMDACVRLLPGVMNTLQSAEEESFHQNLLEYPHYTKPQVWEDRNVPEILFSGHHGHIREWRKRQAEMITKTRRPDLWQSYCETTKKGLS